MAVFDISGSMWGQVDGVAKVEIARNAFGGALSDWQAYNMRTGLIAYGHRRRGDCADIEVMARPGDDADIAALVAGLSPVGKSPLSEAVRKTAEVLPKTEEAATVVLLSDGVETCEADSCAVGVELEALGLDFTAHVIRFDIAEGDRAQLQSLADATSGLYFDSASRLTHSTIIGRIRRPDKGELASAMQSGQVECIDCIVLHTPHSRLNGCAGRRNHLTGMPKPNQVAMQAIATRASLIGKR